MKNKEFFYLQYNKINWENQEKTKINSFVYSYIIKEIILKKKGLKIKIFDIGFGIGLFIRKLHNLLRKFYEDSYISGCEPSEKNYEHFLIRKPINLVENVTLRTYKSTFQDLNIKDKFDFITAIYVFPHFMSEELEKIAEKIYSMLDENGKFILVIANEKYLKDKLKDKRDLFIEKNTFEWDGKKYQEVLHYSDIPQIGKVIDYDREESFYLDLFNKFNFKLVQKTDLDDNSFICTLFIFEK